MSELTSCIEAAVQMMGKCVEAQADSRSFRQHVTAQVTRLFQEGLDARTVIALLIDRQHEKSEAKIVGQSNHDHLDISDFNVIERKIGINEPTPDNRKRWEKKFEEKRAVYLCPQCGYAGNSEFKDVSSVVGSADYIQCPLCSCLEYRRFFTRDWTPEARATFEQEREASRKAKAEAAIAKAGIAERQKKLLDKVRSDAVTAVKAIDEFQWNLNGEEPAEWSWDEEAMEPEIRRVMQLILRPTFEGWLPVPQDDIVVFFKANLRPSEDLETTRQEFKRCAKAFNFETLRAMAGEEER